MSILKYILLYLPWVLISTLGFIYYGIGGYEGMRAEAINDGIALGLQGADLISYTQERLKIIIELGRASHFLGYLPLFILLYIVWKERRTTDNMAKDMPLRVQLSYMICLIVAPKCVDHLLTVIKVITENPFLHDAYTESRASLFFAIIYFIVVPIRIKKLNKKMRTNV